MSGADRIKLMPADHVLIHGVGALLSADSSWPHLELTRGIVRDVLPRVNTDNPALTDLIAAGRALTRPDGASVGYAHRAALRDFHARRMGAAWDLIREEFQP